MDDAAASRILDTLLSEARKVGADACDAVLFASTDLGVSWRLGKVEEVERSEGQDLGLRVLVGARQAAVSTTDHSDAALKELAQRCVAMAKLAPEDPYCGLAPAERLATAPFRDMDLLDESEPSAETLTELAKEAEEAALNVEGVTNSSGASADWSSGAKWIATSAGFFGGGHGSRHSISCSVLAGEGLEMERDYDYTSAVHAEDLGDAAKVGRTAGERAVRRLSPRKVQSQSAPVIYENRLAASLIRHLAGAANGGAIARGVSFLKDKLGEQLFSPEISIIDDPHRRRGFASKPFDGEGVETAPIKLVDKGVLTSWIMNSAHARQLGLETTGRATRGVGGAPGASTTNLHMEPGALTREALMADIKEGLFVTDMFGPSVNSNTGDYSVGVSGFWIDNGEIAYPVNEVTIAGNILDMYKALTPANDLEFRSAANAPSLRIDGMTIGGA
ncbi:MAG: TldD/PmbA family protein [Pseudomonadota bacterium]